MSSSLSNYLFYQPASVRDLTQHQHRRMATEISMLSLDSFVAGKAEEIVRHLAGKYAFLVPVLDSGAATTSMEDVELDAPRQGDPVLDRLSKTAPRPGRRATIAVPFKGDAAFFTLQPEEPILPLPRGETHAGMLLCVMEAASLPPDAVAGQFAEWLQLVEGNLAVHRKAVAGFNAGLLSDLGLLLRHRRALLQARHDVLGRIAESRKS